MITKASNYWFRELGYHRRNGPGQLLLREKIPADLIKGRAVKFLSSSHSDFAKGARQP